LFSPNHISEIQEVDLKTDHPGSYSLSVLREDKIHFFVSGNKFRKLKYNSIEAQCCGQNRVLSFGGAYSNHIAAVAAMGEELDMSTIGVIRGEELVHKVSENPTLSFARECGMRLHFVSRADYKNKSDPGFIEILRQKFKDFYLIPEGGTNTLAVKGCEEILSESTSDFDYVCVSVGTGGTISGLINSSEEHQTVLGFSALKGIFQISEIKKYTSKNNYRLLDDYCFGGYGKIDSSLIRFINEFKKRTHIPLDPIYTGKMMFGIFQMIKNKKFKENSRILAIHTGGLQGIAGMNLKLKKKNLPQIL
jgi:1-aminocyclopropane-1-carboxylate deaminase/D-cysteine desulfhydrase-like pyridoxal-dependent ACC family enzyme